MNQLPEDVLDTIYKYKHQIEMSNVMTELIEHKIHCKYNFAMDALKYMFYVNNDGIRISCLDFSSVNVFAYEILNEIKNKKNKKVI